RDLLGQKRVVPLVVAVEEREVVAARVAEAGVARGPGTGVLLTQNTNARVAPGEVLRDPDRLVARTVVDYQQREIAERLPQYRLDRAVQIVPRVVGRHDYGDGRHQRALPTTRSAPRVTA